MRVVALGCMMWMCQTVTPFLPENVSGIDAETLSTVNTIQTEPKHHFKKKIQFFSRQEHSSQLVRHGDNPD